MFDRFLSDKDLSCAQKMVKFWFNEFAWNSFDHSRWAELVRLINPKVNYHITMSDITKMSIRDFNNNLEGNQHWVYSCPFKFDFQEDYSPVNEDVQQKLMNHMVMFWIAGDVTKTPNGEFDFRHPALVDFALVCTFIRRRYIYPNDDNWDVTHGCSTSLVYLGEVRGKPQLIGNGVMNWYNDHVWKDWNEYPKYTRPDHLVIKPLDGY